VKDKRYHSDTFASSHKENTEAARPKSTAYRGAEVSGRTKGHWIVNPAGLEITIGKAFNRESVTYATIKVCSLMALDTPGVVFNSAREIVK